MERKEMVHLQSQPKSTRALGRSKHFSWGKRHPGTFQQRKITSSRVHSDWVIPAAPEIDDPRKLRNSLPPDYLGCLGLRFIELLAREATMNKSPHACYAILRLSCPGAFSPHIF